MRGCGRRLVGPRSWSSNLSRWSAEANEASPNTVTLRPSKWEPVCLKANPGSYDCYGASRRDRLNEPLFTLRARDPHRAGPASGTQWVDLACWCPPGDPAFTLTCSDVKIAKQTESPLLAFPRVEAGEAHYVIEPRQGVGLSPPPGIASFVNRHLHLCSRIARPQAPKIALFVGSGLAYPVLAWLFLCYRFL